MLKTIAVIFGVIILLVGILGFIPALTPHNHLLGIFHVNTVHNVIHILSGAIALWVGLTSDLYSQYYFRIFGIVYGLVAILGFFYGERPILGIIANNMADTWLHVVIAALSIYLGFFYTETIAPKEKDAP